LVEIVKITGSRDVLLRDEKPGRGPLLQSLSAGESGTLEGGPMSPRPLNVPALRPEPSSSLGLNLLPIVQVSSLSAAPALSETNAEFLRLEAASDSDGAGGRVERLERQSLEVSETEEGGGCRSVCGPSWRRRDESREARSGRGPCRRHSPENFGSS
jgi:hypothetical protein